MMGFSSISVINILSVNSHFVNMVLMRPVTQSITLISIILRIVDHAKDRNMKMLFKEIFE